MPIARGAACSSRRQTSGQFNISSSTFSDEQRPSSGGRWLSGLSNNDDFVENSGVPSHIKEYHNQSSQLSQEFSYRDYQHGYNEGEDDEKSEVEELHWVRRKCGEFIDDERTQMFILVLIAINSIMYGVATFPAVKDSPRISGIFDTVDLIVLVIFTIESVMQFVFNGLRRFLKDGWLVFDLIIVLISWVAVEISELGPLRVFRAFRFLTRVSVLRNVVVALFSIVPAITAIFTLLLLIFYIFSVMFTQLFKESMPYYFGRMDYTLFTLFQILCLDEWADIAYEVIAVHYWAWAIFVAFIVMSAFVVVNLLIAVICDALQILRTAEEAMIEQKKKLYGQEVSDEDEGGEDEGRGGALALGKHHHQTEEEISNERIRQKVNDMQQMLEEMVAAQETMARTLQYLSLALYAEREPDSLWGIRENASDDPSRDMSESLKDR